VIAVLNTKILNSSSEEAWSQFKDLTTFKRNMDYIQKQNKLCWVGLLQVD
jgi:hypothetical protein